MWLTAKEVMFLLGGVSRATAYKVMRDLGNEFEAMGKARPPAGKIQKRFFCEKFLFELSECDAELAKMKGCCA